MAHIISFELYTLGDTLVLNSASRWYQVSKVCHQMVLHEKFPDTRDRYWIARQGLQSKRLSIFEQNFEILTNFWTKFWNSGHRRNGRRTTIDWDFLRRLIIEFNSYFSYLFQVINRHFARTPSFDFWMHLKHITMEPYVLWTYMTFMDFKLSCPCDFTS